MPQQLPPQGPFQRVGGQCFYIVEERISLQPDKLVEDPPTRTADMNPPECWFELTYERRRVDIEYYRIVEYLAAEKELSGWEIAGLIVLGVVVVATGAGAIAAFAGAATAASAAAAAGTTAMTATIGVKLGAGAALTASALAVGKAELDLAKELLADAKLSDPDDWEITTSVLNTLGPLRRELNSRPERPRTERFTIACDRPITGIDEFINTNYGLDTGTPPSTPNGASGGAPGDGTAPVGSGSGTAPIGTSTGGGTGN